MTAAVYYFTGTGNCLAVARIVADRLGCQPVSIADIVGGPTIQTDADTVGIVYPAYLAAVHGVPLMVERFVLQLEGIESKRLFAICTCGGYEMFNAVPTLSVLAKVVRDAGSRLSAEYTVRLPMNNLDYEHIPVPIETDSAVIISKAQVQVDRICERILSGRNGKNHTLRRIINAAMAPVYAAMRNPTVQSLKEYAGEQADSSLTFRELVPRTDCGIRVDASCTGCGVCAQVCPAGNIEIVGGRPRWLHHCEMCTACDEWCPVGAVHHWQRPNGAKYHHPSVTAKDLRVNRSSRGAAQRRDRTDGGARALHDA